MKRRRKAKGPAECDRHTGRRPPGCVACTKEVAELTRDTWRMYNAMLRTVACAEEASAPPDVMASLSAWYKRATAVLNVVMSIEPKKRPKP